MVDIKRYLDFEGLTKYNSYVDQKKADKDSPEFTGNPTAPTPDLKDKSKKIATTEYVVNSIAESLSSKYVLKEGDTMTGPLKFNTDKRPILDLHLTGSNLSNVYSLTTNGSLYIGDATSNSGARVYFARNVDKLNTALLTGVSIGYNPRDQVNWSSTTDYGIKFDVNVAKSNTNAIESAQIQSASFFVGLKGAYVGYSGDHRTALTSAKVYRVLDSNSVKQDDYIKSLEKRIVDLEEKLNTLLLKESN